jgi:hypothetical protein
MSLERLQQLISRFRAEVGATVADGLTLALLSGLDQILRRISRVALG